MIAEKTKARPTFAEALGAESYEALPDVQIVHRYGYGIPITEFLAYLVSVAGVCGIVSAVRNLSTPVAAIVITALVAVVALVWVPAVKDLRYKKREVPAARERAQATLESFRAAISEDLETTYGYRVDPKSIPLKTGTVTVVETEDGQKVQLNFAHKDASISATTV